MALEDFFSRFGDGLALVVGWIGNGYHWAAVIVGILIATFPVYKFIDGKLADDESYEWFLSRVRADGWRAGWQRLVCAGLDLLDEWFGPSHSRKAFARCLSLAYIYPFFALLAGFTAGGSLGKIGDSLGSDGWEPSQGAVLVLIFASIYLALFYSIPILERRARSLVDLALHGRAISERARNRMRGVVAFVALVASGVAGAVVAGVAFALFDAFGAVVAGVAGVAAVAGIAVITGAAVVAVVTVVAFVALGAFVAGVTFGAGVADVLILFIALPLLNAGLDWLSWWASRGLMSDLFRRDDTPVPGNPGKWRILWHLFFDIVFAALALLALAAVLPFGLGLANRFGTEFPWRDLVADGRDHPLTQGLGVTIMLATTLIPTALHLIAALFSLIFPNLWRIWRGVGKDTPDLQKSWLLAVSFASVFVSIALFFGGLVIFFSLIRAGFPEVAPLLADMALWIGDWAEGAR